MSDDGLPGVAMAVALLVGLAVNVALLAKLLLIAFSAALVLVQ